MGRFQVGCRFISDHSDFRCRSRIRRCRVSRPLFSLTSLPRLTPPSKENSSSAIPIHVLVGLFYRVLVLYAATRIVLTLKRETGGYVDSRTLREEEPAARIMTLILTYSRAGLIAVCTFPLLYLDPRRS